METTREIVIRFNFSRRQALYALAVFFIAWHPGFIGSETLTLTTYYPAPYGGYVNLLTTGQTLLARNSGQVLVGTPGPFAGGYPGVAIRNNAGMGGLVVSGSGGDVNRAYSSLYLYGSNMNVQNSRWVVLHKDGQEAGKDGDLEIWRNNPGGDIAAMTFDGPTGNVGINERTPTRRLHVTGDIRIGSQNTAATGSLYGLCHTQGFGSGTSTCTGGTVVTAVYGNECQTGGMVLKQGSVNMMLASSWVPHMAQNCTGTMLCCRIVPNAN
ncbi:MAG: hypothetical protein Q7R35_08425 [Elusimicrobiota bacterium]|nr:hypothetical protein [Elusimicrobiota bacterium]